MSDEGTATWPEIERRKNDLTQRAVIQEKLDVALAEIQRLYGAATLTADALTKALPRQESEDRAIERAEEQKRMLVVVSVAHLLLMLMLLWAFTVLGVAWVRSSVERDHAILRCLATTPEKDKVSDPRGAITKCVTTMKE